MKRLFDIVLSGIAILVFSPLLLITAIVLRLTGEGQVWFRQERIGYQAKRFNVLKFATMRKDSEFTGTRDITLLHDPRVLPVGRILRKMKINELPQLINVLKGEMSFVGWRPLLVKSFDYYPQDVQKKIVNGKPGLTGVGSVIFRDEDLIVARSSKSPQEVYRDVIGPYKGTLELWYQKNQSLWLDLKLVLLTIIVLVHPRSRIIDWWLKGLPRKPDEILQAHKPQPPANNSTAQVH